MANLSSVVMPKWGMEMAEGDIAEWHVAVGDNIQPGADIVDVETAKIVNTVTSNDGGSVVRLCANIGDTIPVGGLLVVLSDGAVSDEEVDAFIASCGGGSALEPMQTSATPAPSAPAQKDASTAGTAETVVPQNVSTTLAEGPDDSAIAASPVARRVAAENRINLNNVTATGRHGRVALHDIRVAAERAGISLNLPDKREFEGSKAADDSHLKATPVARRLAQELGISLHECRNTGRHGRISKADVEVVAGRKQTPVSRASTPSHSADVNQSAVSAVKLSGARRTIATVVSKAKQEVPHFRVNIDVDVSAAMALRSTLNARRSDVKISLNDIVIKACSVALHHNPAINARFDGETLERHSQANIASAVATDNGVLMPVLTDAGVKNLAEISSGMRDLATRAKTGRLNSSEMNSATFSISNLGMFGIDSFDAIINQPAVTILAVGSAEQRPVVRDGELSVGLVMTLSLASDHRVVDGADAARFLADLKGYLEEPALMLG